MSLSVAQILQKVYEKQTLNPHTDEPTVDAGVVTNLVDDASQAPRYSNRAAIMIKNTGANTIKYAVYEHPDATATFDATDGGDWVARVPETTINAGESDLIKLDPINPLNVKIVVLPNAAGVQSTFTMHYELSR